jgi:hypothetical protein
MEYPPYTASKPVTGEAATALLEAIRNGSAITNPAAEATIRRILQRRHAEAVRRKQEAA